MLYPKISNFKKESGIMKILVLVSLLVSLICLLINELTSGKIHWAVLCISGIVYIWITGLYSIRKNVNIASHVMIQMFCASILCFVVDYIVGYKGWSLSLALPIIVGVANIAILVLTIVSRKRYLKYVIYQIIIFLFSFIPVLFYFLHLTDQWIAMTISSGVAMFTLICSVILCGKDIKQEITKTFHI